MQNDMLKNTIAPWQEKGRWFHGVADCTTKQLIKEKTDAFLFDNCILSVFSSNSVGIHEDTTKPLNTFQPLQLIRDLSNVGLSGAVYTLSTTEYINSRGSRAILLYSYDGTATGTVEFWVFAITK